MAPQSALISSLSLNKKDVLLHVRATRIWESFSVDKKSSQRKMLNTKVVFIDEEVTYKLVFQNLIMRIGWCSSFLMIPFGPNAAIPDYADGLEQPETRLLSSLKGRWRL